MAGEAAGFRIAGPIQGLQVYTPCELLQSSLQDAPVGWAVEGPTLSGRAQAGPGSSTGCSSLLKGADGRAARIGTQRTVRGACRPPEPPGPTVPSH